MEYNVVTNQRILSVIKPYKNFRKSMGFTATMEVNKERVWNEADKFALFYNKRYKAAILGEGYIGDISFYNDHLIREDQLAIYVGEEEFVFDFNWKLYKEKGIEWYLGYLLKDVDFKLQEISKPKVEIKNQPKKGNPYKLVYGHKDYSPGNTSWDDIKAYQEAKRTGLIK
jgi:hypothetical protein